MKIHSLSTYGLLLLAVGFVNVKAGWSAEPIPPYPSAEELQAMPTMVLPKGWTWNGNIQSGGPPDGKFYGLNTRSDTKLWQGTEIQNGEADTLMDLLTKTCRSRQFAEALVKVRQRWDDMQDITDRQLFARVNWDSDPTGGADRQIQTLEVRYQLKGGVCGEVQPLGLTDNPHFKGETRRWIIY